MGPIARGGEARSDGPSKLPVAVVEPWRRPFPWLVAGMTRRYPGEQRPNFGLFTDLLARGAMRAWEGLLGQLRVRRAVHSKQVHGDRVTAHDGASGPGRLLIAEAGDGHATATPGVLLTVTVADCVPVFVVDPVRRAIALLHAGWRGGASGILERGFETLRDAYGSTPESCWIHLGTSICGACYEVGPEVVEAFGLPPAPTLDLRRVLTTRATSAGVRPERVGTDAGCTLCHQERHFSHRGGDPGRQVAYLMIREE